MTYRSAGSVIVVWLISVIGVGCFSPVVSGDSDQEQECLFENAVAMKEFQRKFQKELSTHTPKTMWNAGEQIFLSLDRQTRDEMTRALKRVADEKELYSFLSVEIDEKAFSGYYEGCTSSVVEYPASSAFEWILSLAGDKWGSYDRAAKCVGYCAEAGKYGQFNATEKLRLSLYIYLYGFNHPDSSAADAMSALGFDSPHSPQKKAVRRNRRVEPAKRIPPSLSSPLR